MTNISSPFQSHLSLVHDSLTPLKPNLKNVRAKKSDPIYSPTKQAGANCISVRDPERRIRQEREGLEWNSRAVIRVSKEEKKLFQKGDQLAEHYTDLIHHHVNMRVSLFFQQAVICFNTPFHYEIAETEGQIFTAKNLKVRAKGESGVVEIKYQAAHSSTIPSLKACPISDYNKALKKNRQPKYFSFLEDAYLDSLNNSTVGLPIFVNQVDTLIDGKSEEHALRDDAILLLNRVALGTLSPCQATRQFLDDFQRQLVERPCKSQQLTDAKKKTISIYKQKVKEMIALAKAPTDRRQKIFFDDLLLVNLSDEEDRDVPILRKILYKRKFEIIREAQFAEAKIQHIIDEHFPRAVKSADKHSVRLCLLLCAKNDPLLRARLQKLFAFSICGIEKDAKLLNALENRYDATPNRYQNTLREIRAVVQEFQYMEQGFQAMLLRQLRVDLRALTQEELSEAIAEVVKKKVKKEEGKLHPNQEKIQNLREMPVSPTTISRLENSRLHIEKEYKTPIAQRRKTLTLYQAKILSKALNVNPGHFFGSFFASADSP